MISLVDTHCHLDFDAFHTDLPAVLERARQNGIDRIVIPATDLDSCQRALKLANLHEGLYVAVGVHPNESAGWNSSRLNKLRDFAKDEKVVAIGEIGLDYYRDRSPRQDQLRAFSQQLELAAHLGLPVIVHNRQASTDLIPLLVEWHEKLQDEGNPVANAPGVLHSYSDELKYACNAIDAGFYIGVTGPVTFPNARDLRHVITRLPLERLLVETDAPFLTPVPHRGKRNEPAYVRFVAEEIARLHERQLDEVARITSQNAKVLFHW